ncbi:uncharacterized protein N0V89_010117 [Didymosphaeria variabile]|uniref:Uncharacterized protein n=1 Tax=Didymosphaeria variabile TaxID=1932322 RepID=A0A9W8XFM0_9PLEO|nr:uncharacterized protein N0V89_010117 [Didymosphaeria variabile]KAJ4348739.1 hypothetical protein N0V89_010117 [Didymosphaeria variabile]
MDPLSFASTAISALEVYTRVLRYAQDLYTETRGSDWVALLGRHIVIFDLKAGSHNPPDILLEGNAHTAEKLSNLPGQTDATCRVYIVHEADEDEVFKEYFEQLLRLPFNIFNRSISNSVTSPLNRRLKGDQMPWWQEGISTFGSGANHEGLFEGVVQCSANGPYRSVWYRMILLRICYAVLIGNADFLRATKNLYERSLQHLDDPGRTTITAVILKVFSRDSYFWELLNNDITLFGTAVESLLSSLQLATNVTEPIELKELLIEVQGQSTAVERQASSITLGLDNRLKFLEMGRSLHESGRVQLLSLLAVVFLPLSLASSILSMQTRFVDLHYLLYDFFGVIFLLGTLTFFLFGILLLLRWAYGTLYNFMESITRSNLFRVVPGLSRIRLGKYAPLVVILLMWVPWALIVASFLVGMNNDVGLGLRILGYGFAGITVLFWGLLLLVWLI